MVLPTQVSVLPWQWPGAVLKVAAGKPHPSSLGEARGSQHPGPLLLPAVVFLCRLLFLACTSPMAWVELMTICQPHEFLWTSMYPPRRCLV